MADSPLGRVVDHLRVTLALPDEAAFSDAHLLARFIETRDEGAFAALTRRYGPLVMAVCDAALNNQLRVIISPRATGIGASVSNINLAQSREDAKKHRESAMTENDIATVVDGIIRLANGL